MSTVAQTLAPVVRRIFSGDPPLDILCWDSSSIASRRSPPAQSRLTLVIESPLALRRLLWQPGELGLARAYVAGDLRLDGDIYELFRCTSRMPPVVPSGWTAKLSIGRELVDAARSLGVFGRPPAPPPEEARISGRLHSRGRDAAAISHHYDVSSDFYRLVLGESMTYSCAYFPTSEATLEEAQEAKYELICRKLGLLAGMRLLDVGCGWGGMVMHAALRHGVRGVGITISAEQAAIARERVRAAGLEEMVEIRLQDYRAIHDGPYDAISSIGMVEHVGRERLPEYFERLRGLLKDGGRLLNHQICSRRSTGRLPPRSFMARYVFPDGELHDVGHLAGVMQTAGLEVRDTESLREHYALTLRHWVRNLESDWDEAVRVGGAGRARVWRLYMAGSAVAFETGRITVQQLLGVRAGPEGQSGMPLSRSALLL